MVKSYIAVASPFGLQALLLDDDRLLALIAPRKRFTPSRHRVCFRATVRDDVAKEIQQEILAGHRRQALLTLDCLATDLVPLGW